MGILFFYGSAVIVWIGFAIILRYKSLNLASIMIGITTVAYSMIFDTFFGVYKGYYYYISKEGSAFYVILAAILIYPVLNIAYVMFLPKKSGQAFVYTVMWILMMLVFELISFKTKTIVDIRWRVVPWSFVTYIVTYTWVYVFYQYLINKGLEKIRYFKHKKA